MPDEVCLVPERAEVTTEGGLDAVGNWKRFGPRWRV